jgi:transposase
MAVSDWEVEGTLAKAQRDAIVKALVDCNYKISAAAAKLRIGRSTIYRLIEAFEIEIPAKGKRKSRPLSATHTRKVAENDTGDTSRIIFKDGRYLLTRG